MNRSDGTEQGTVLVSDIRVGRSGSYPTDLTNANGTLFFVASNGTNGRELWSTDGTAAGTRPIPISEHSHQSSHSLTHTGNQLFFTALDFHVGRESWILDLTIVSDLDGDGRVNVHDADILFSQCGGSGNADMNRDGVVDAADAGILFENWTERPAAVEYAGARTDGRTWNAARHRRSTVNTVRALPPCTPLSSHPAGKAPFARPFAHTVYSEGSRQ